MGALREIRPAQSERATQRRDPFRERATPSRSGLTDARSITDRRAGPAKPKCRCQMACSNARIFASNYPDGSNPPFTLDLLLFSTMGCCWAQPGPFILVRAFQLAHIPFMFQFN